MAMPQRDDLVDEILKTDALLEYAVMHGEETERLRAKLRRLASMGDGDATEVGCGDCQPIWNGQN